MENNSLPSRFLSKICVEITQKWWHFFSARLFPQFNGTPADWPHDHFGRCFFLRGWKNWQPPQMISLLWPFLMSSFKFIFLSVEKTQTWHLWAFSRLWFLLWVFKILLVVAAYSHLSHWNGFAPVCFLLWHFNAWPWVVAKSHSSHLNGFSPVYSFVCSKVSWLLERHGALAALERLLPCVLSYVCCQCPPVAECGGAKSTGMWLLTSV